MNLLRPAVRLLLILAPLAAGHAADTAVVARPDFQNLSGPDPVNGNNPGLILLQNHRLPAAVAPGNIGIRLTELSLGQPFAQWIPDAAEGARAAYAARVAEEVRIALYPPADASRAVVEGGGKVFRYKWLLFSPNQGETDVTNHFENIDDWFTQADRTAAKAQIAKLRAALARAPLDTGLRHLLLDCYYDLAVAEVQGAKKLLAVLATKRLGLQLVSPFIIDDEIIAYEQLTAQARVALGYYEELLTYEVDGVNPADFDDRVTGDMPMGYYIFVQEQPRRNTMAMQYAGADGTETVPEYDAEEKEIVERDPEVPLFSGYKDYTTYLRLMADYVRYHAELARLRGMRQGANDVSKARKALTGIMKGTATDFLLMRALYPSGSFPAGDASGVNAAVNSVETALADVTNVQSFLNGKSNVLGLDENFLLLMQQSKIDGVDYFDTFDILRRLIVGTNHPLTVAIEKKALAEKSYHDFRASVDKVVEELDSVDSNYAGRYVEITGYAPDADPGFQGLASPGGGSELDLVERTIESVLRRQGLLKTLDGNLADDLSTANAAVKVAEGLSDSVDTAVAIYQEQTKNAWTELHVWAGLSAGSQAVTDGVHAIAGLDPTKFPVGQSVAIAISTAANTAVQTAAGVRSSIRQQELDYAAIGFEATTEKTDAALTVNQARQEVGAITRELYGHKLETEDNNSALSQAIAQQTALLNEVRRITANRDGDTAGVRSKFYADPIHYVRAENALIDADEAFREAQRWVFYTQKALEHKWQQRFSRTQGSRSWDGGSIFKLRNASELNDLLTQMVLWDLARSVENIPGTGTTFISLRDDVLAPDPGKLNKTFAPDTNLRVNFRTGETLSPIGLFRAKLRAGTDSLGFITVPFNTVLLQDLPGNFFRGPDYLANGTVIPGKWRDKIEYIKVNMIAEDGVAIPRVIIGSLTYGGNTFVRTRVPPAGNRAQPTNAPASPDAKDMVGEFTIAPFRFYTSVDFNNVFVAADRQGTSIDMAYTGASARSITGEEILGATFLNTAFAERSVAATEWNLTINPNQVDIDKLKDIEIIVKHRFSDRVAPIAP